MTRPCPRFSSPFTNSNFFTFHVWILQSKSLPTTCFVMRVFRLMVSSFKAVPYGQYHFELLQHSSLATWNKRVPFLDHPIFLISRTKLALALWVTSALAVSSIDSQVGPSICGSKRSGLDSSLDKI